MTLTRRGLLGALAAGSVGGLTGRGAVALLSDQEATTHALTTGVVDIVVDYWSDIGTDAPDLAAPDSSIDGTDIGIDAGLEPGGAIRDLLRVRLPQDGETPNNPARVWLSSGCPEATLLGEVLRVRVSYADETGARRAPIASGSLRGVTDALRGGLPLDGGPDTDGDGCLSDALYLLVEFELSGYVGSESVSLPMTLAAVQCRNADPGLNPFSGDETAPCEQVDCRCCWAIGKLEVDQATTAGPLEAGESYSFTEGLAGYSIAVTEVDGDSGAAFTLLRDDGVPAPPLCRVEVTGGPDDEALYEEPAELGVSTDVFPGAADGLVYAPANPNSGTNYGISHIIVAVCAPGDDCPDDVVQNAQSSNRGGGK